MAKELKNKPYSVHKSGFVTGLSSKMMSLQKKAGRWSHVVLSSIAVMSGKGIPGVFYIADLQRNKPGLKYYIHISSLRLMLLQ